jgi:hypothetical protein
MDTSILQKIQGYKMVQDIVAYAEEGLSRNGHLRIDKYLRMMEELRERY